MRVSRKGQKPHMENHTGGAVSVDEEADVAVRRSRLVALAAAVLGAVLVPAPAAVASPTE